MITLPNAEQPPFPVRIPVRDDDDLDELPPLDGDPGDAESAPGFDLDDPDESGPGDDDLDDATGENEPLDAGDLGVDEGEAAWLGEPQDAGDLDVGGDDVLDVRDDGTSFVEGVVEGHDPESADFGLEDVPEAVGLDSGEEGPLDADEELREADLPPLGADDEEDEDDLGFLVDSLATDHPAGLPWADRPLARVGAPVAVASATAVACIARGALVAGRTEGGDFVLLRVDLEGESRSLPAFGLRGEEVSALAVEGQAVAAVLGDGRLMVSRDGGMRFEPHAEGLVATDVVMVSGTLWVRTSARGLAVSVAGGPLQRRSVPGAVAALCSDGESGITALVVDDADVPAAFLRGRSDGSVESQPISAPEACGQELVAARGLFVAYSGRRGVVRRESDAVWHAHRWEGCVTALAFIDPKGSLVAATYSDSDDTTALVHLDESGKASIVARLGPARADGDVDGRASALACDDAHGVLWVAGGFGVAAFAIR